MIYLRKILLERLNKKLFSNNFICLFRKLQRPFISTEITGIILQMIVVLITSLIANSKCGKSMDKKYNPEDRDFCLTEIDSFVLLRIFDYKSLFFNYQLLFIE